MSGKPTIGLSILSWRGAGTLDDSLRSYADAKLFEIFDDAQLFLPDPDEDVRKVANIYPLRKVEQESNLGIMGNMIAAAESMSTDYLLMLENDCPLIEPVETVKKHLNRAVEIMKDETVVAAHFRSVAHPGEAMTGPVKYAKLYKPGLINVVIRVLRPGKVRRLSGYAANLGAQAMAQHPGCFEDLGDGFVLIDNTVRNWTNQSVLVRRKHFLNVIIPAAKMSKTRRGANGLPNLEIELSKSSIWRDSGWKTLLTPGAFTHERSGYRGYE